ncbi:MAG: YggT family protein [Armatimonadota bacterium]
MLRSQIIWAIDILLNAYYVLLLVRVIFSWLDLRRPHPILIQVHRIAYAATEPLLRPIRNFLLKYQRGMPLDLSPLIAWFLIEFARRVIVRSLL